MSRLRDMASGLLGSVGIVGVADVKVVGASSTSALGVYWRQYAQRNFYSTINSALASCSSGRNDVVLITPESHSQSATITWSKNMTHLVGMYGPGRLNLRPRIGHSAALSPLLTVSGYGCTFANFYMMYGYGTSTTDLNAVNITGNRNTFANCHIGSPMQEPQANSENFKVINIEEESAGAGLEHYFYKCVIGVETVPWTNGVMCRYAGTPRLVFEDCIFLMSADNSQVKFIDGTSGDGAGFVIFKNCIGLNRSTTALTVAIGSTGIASATRYVLLNSGFAGVTDTIAATDEAKVLAIATGVTTSDDTDIGLAVPFDHTA